MKIIIIFLILMFPLNAMSAEQKTVPLRLRLQSDKRVYKPSEKLSLVTFLQNQSEENSYFIGRKINAYFINTFFHGVNLSVKNMANQEMPRPMIAGDPAFDALDAKTGQVKLPFSAMQEEYILLNKGTLYGFSAKISIKLRPGKYKLKATYDEAAYLQFTQDEIKSLTAPIWTQKLISNEVIITVKQ